MSQFALHSVGYAYAKQVAAAMQRKLSTIQKPTKQYVISIGLPVSMPHSATKTKHSLNSRILFHNMTSICID
jgi:hypothetical protein